jgi:predicted lipoprotein with Yx(FWY)xxD motif
VTSAGNVARDTTAAAAVADTARRDTAVVRDTAVTRDTMVTRDTTVAAPPPAAPTTQVQLMVSEASGVGAYLTDANGRAVYILEGPDGMTVSCAGECATDFEPVTGTAVVATGDTVVQATLIGSVPMPNGMQQVTYEGKPLYFARADQAKGDTKGQGSKSYGTARLVTPKK